MAEYFDIGTNINHMMGTLEDHNYTLKSYIKSFLGLSTREESQTPPQSKIEPVIDKQLLAVRDSICVVGYNASAVQWVKQQIAALVDQPLPLESLHIKKPGDIKEGALMVPKVVLVANHIPGRKLIDDDGNNGQLDQLYDEVCDIGAEVMLIYLGLPRAIYPSVRHMVYHPRMAEIVFPSQPTLRRLAEDYCLVTLREKGEFSSMQRNVIREWLTRPVGRDHAVYATADRMRMTFSDAEFWSESELFKYRRPVPYHATTQYASAYECSSPKKERVKKKRKKGEKVVPVEVGNLIDLGGAEGGGSGHIELEMYNGEGGEGEGVRTLAV